MANYSLTRHTTVISDSADAALALLETHLETVVDTKTIHYIEVLTVGPGKYFQGVVLYAT